MASTAGPAPAKSPSPRHATPEITADAPPRDLEPPQTPDNLDAQLDEDGNPADNDNARLSKDGDDEDNHANPDPVLSSSALDHLRDFVTGWRQLSNDEELTAFGRQFLELWVSHFVL